jgi:phage gpG-like protein
VSEPIKFDLDGENGARIRRLFAKLTDVRPVLRDFGGYKQRQIVMSFPRLPRGTASAIGGPPAMRTGLLAQRITYEVTGPLLEVGTRDIRAAMLQYGGTVRPKSAKALTIPVSPEAYGKRARDFSNLVLIKPRMKDPESIGLLVRKKGRGKKETTEALFVLRRSAKIEARPFLAWKPQDKKYLLTALQRQFERS